MLFLGWVWGNTYSSKDVKLQISFRQTATATQKPIRSNKYFALDLSDFFWRLVCMVQLQTLRPRDEEFYLFWREE